MEIFGVGPFELLLVVIIGFLVLGPERIPGVMRSLGKAIRQLQQAMQKMLTTEAGGTLSIPHEVAELQRDLNSLRSDFKQMTQQIVSAPERLVTPPKSGTAPQENKAPGAASTDSAEIIDLGAPPQV